MSKLDLPGSKWNKDSDEWKSWPPDFFLSVLLHELRNPLMLIKGYVEILSDETAKEHHPVALETISKNIEKLEQIYGDITDYIGELRKKPDS
jgi:signal transduction histidine kinase